MIENLLVGKHVLIAEDNAINQMVAKHTLVKMGATADIVSDGVEAIEKIKSSNYDLVLMDIQMPLMDGYEAAQYIRKQLNSNVPIIAMTAFALNGEHEKCLEFGMDNYISKPFSIEEFTDIIQKVLSLAQERSSSSQTPTNDNVSVDLSLLYDVSGDDEGYISMMLQTFLENMPVTLDKLAQNLQERDWEGVYKLAHYAKSSLSVIKVKEMMDAVMMIEEKAKKRIDLDEVPALAEKAFAAFKLAKEVLLKKIEVINI